MLLVLLLLSLDFFVCGAHGAALERAEAHGRELQVIHECLGDAGASGGLQ